MPQLRGNEPILGLNRLLGINMQELKPEEESAHQNKNI
jgi:hypothetical protein